MNGFESQDVPWFETVAAFTISEARASWEGDGQQSQYQHQTPGQLSLKLTRKESITTKVCTCHDSCAVVACAKFCVDLMGKN